MEIQLTGSLAGPRSLPDPDAVYIRQMACGDEAALQSVYVKYGRRMFAFAVRLVGDREVAEEVLQDSLLAAWKGARSFRGEGRVITWLLGIVHNQAQNAIRRKRLPATELDEAADSTDGTEGPDRLAERADRHRAIAMAIGQLSPQHRAVLTLVFYEGLDLAEAAKVCNCPVGTVKSRLSYAKAYLREALRRAGLNAEDLL